MKRRAPKLRTDRDAEAFLAEDLSNLDFAQFKPVRFSFAEKAYLRGVESTLPEWSSPEDSAAYDGLLKAGKRKPKRRRRSSRSD
jgi:hypothetical protein